MHLSVHTARSGQRQLMAQLFAHNFIQIDYYRIYHSKMAEK